MGNVEYLRKEISLLFTDLQGSKCRMQNLFTWQQHEMLGSSYKNIPERNNHKQ